MTSWISIIKFNFLDSGFFGYNEFLSGSTHHLVGKELLYLCALSLSHSSSHCPLYRPLLCECYKFECCYYSSSFAQIQIRTNTNTKTTVWMNASNVNSAPHHLNENWFDFLSLQIFRRLAKLLLWWKQTSLLWVVAVLVISICICLHSFIFCLFLDICIY